MSDVSAFWPLARLFGTRCPSLTAKYRQQSQPPFLSIKWIYRTAHSYFLLNRRK
jgi:hypothetical protein